MVSDIKALIEHGLSKHLDSFHQATAPDGSPRLGWKVAFNAPSMQRQLDLPYSLVAGLTARTLIENGGSYVMAGTARVALEAEVAVRLSADVDPGQDTKAIASAVEAWAPAIEIVELDRPFEELEAILAEGVFHRALVLGRFDAPAAGADLGGIAAHVDLADVRVCEVDAREATGHVPEVLRHLARLLEPRGERLAAGDIVLLGAMNPLCMGTAGTRFSVELGQMGSAWIDLVA